jgi:cobalt/nickel transport system ATP-binding protein
MDEVTLDVRDVGFVYPDGTRALESISFQLRLGESVALVGANGAGKSTLLLHLNGYLMAQEGAIQIGNHLLSSKTAPTLRSKVGLVFQDPDDQLFMPTVEEDVAFGPLNAGLPPDAVEICVAQALERVGMVHLRHRPPYRLSAGEKRAVAIASVLAMSPDILVMDEPSTHLDPRARRRLLELLRSFDHTLVLATHDLEMVVEVCSRVIVLDGGRIVADGPALELLNNEPLMLAHGLERPHILQHTHPHH